MNVKDYREISRSRYEEIWSDEHATALPDIPADPTYGTFVCGSIELIESQAYPVWFVDPSKSRFVAYSDSSARPILFSELVAVELLREEKLEERRLRGRFRSEPHVISEHCVDCGVRVIKDGCRGLLQLAADGEVCGVLVTEVSGSDWSDARYDMAVVCRCAR